MFEGLVGKTSNRVKNIVERGAVKKFAEAIGDQHSIYTDEEFGTQSRYGKNIAPPTFPVVFDYGKLEGFKLSTSGLIHGEQVFHYNRPLFVGEEINCYTEVLKYYERSGSAGLMGFLVLMNNGVDDNEEIIFWAKQVIIITEAVRGKLLG